jgi:hypothetical protein
MGGRSLVLIFVAGREDHPIPADYRSNNDSHVLAQVSNANPIREQETAPSEVVKSAPPEDRKIHLAPNFSGNGAVSDGRTYSVALIAGSNIPPNAELFAQGRLAALDNRGVAYIQDERQADKTLICSMTQDEFSDVSRLYPVGKLVQVSGEYAGTANTLPILGNCHVASPTNDVVR